jgi:hypothetical protein
VAQATLSRQTALISDDAGPERRKGDTQMHPAANSTSLHMRRDAIRFWVLPAISGLATLLVAATVDPSENWARLRALPRLERQRLVENLQKFDLVYTPDQKRSLRDLDRRINELDPAQRTQYLSALRRYHNWLDTLPDTVQESLRAKVPGERMELIKKLVKDHPVPRAATARFLQFVDVGDFTPFDLAVIYQIWQSMSPAARQQVEKLPPGPRRKSFFQKGEAKQVAALLKAQGFDEAKWISTLEAFTQSRPIAALLQELKTTEDGRPSEILRRQAINFHFLEKARPTTVDPARLDEFLAGFPPWLQSCFDHHSPDEAKRRLTIVYRLVFPPGNEINQAPKRTTSPAGKQKSAGAGPADE